MPNRTYCQSCWQAVRRHGQFQTVRSAQLATRLQNVTRLASTSAKTIRSDGNPPKPPKHARAAPPSTSTLPFSAASSNPNGTTSIAQQVRQAAPSLTETYVAYGVCELLVKEAARPANYAMPTKDSSSPTTPPPKTAHGEELGVATDPNSWWYSAARLNPTFNTWAQITMLHLYLLTVRIRCFPAEHAPAWHQHLVNHFFYLAEDRMAELHGISSRMMRNKYLKDLFMQWRGLIAGYDEGLVKGDAVLAAAVWRNVFRGEEEGVDFVRLAQVVSYMRSALQQLDGMEDEAVATGDIVFGDPGAEAELVRGRSRLMDEVEQEAERPQKAALVAGQKGKHRA